MKTIKFSLFAVMFFLLMCSCDSNGGNFSSSQNDSSQNDVPMQYTVSTSSDLLFPPKTIRVYECAENGDKIYKNEIKMGTGDSKTFTAQPMVKKVKVYLVLSNPIDWRNDYVGWLPLVYYLSPNDSKIIQIDNDVVLSRDEP